MSNYLDILLDYVEMLFGAGVWLVKMMLVTMAVTIVFLLVGVVVMGGLSALVEFLS